jgi:hypothetical protein
MPLLKFIEDEEEEDENKEDKEQTESEDSEISLTDNATPQEDGRGL